VQDDLWRKLIDAGLAVHSELALEAVLQTLVQRAEALTGARHGALGILDRGGKDFVHAVGRVELLLRPASKGATDTALVVPVLVRGAPYATLVLAGRQDGGAFTPDHEEVVSRLAEHASVAIENARRYESATRWLAQLEALSEIGNAVAGERNFSRLLGRISERLRALLGASTLFVALPRADGDLEIRAADGDASKELLGVRLPRSGSKTGRVFERGRSERVDSLIEDLEVYQPASRVMNARAGLFVPMLSEEEPIGIIVALNKLGDDTFSAADLHLAESFAGRVAAALRLAEPGGTGAPAGGEERSDLAGLTAREVEVLCLVAYGMSDALIAERLVVSLRTVHAHLRSIYKKLGVGSRSAATRWAVEHHLA
jgi:GAF domain-containing protein